MSEQKEVKFVHFRKPKKPGAITVAYFFVGPTLLQVGISFCSPEETQHGYGKPGHYERKKGNSIAQCRLETNPLFIKFDKEPTMSECMDLVSKFLTDKQTWFNGVKAGDRQYKETEIGNAKLSIATRDGVTWAMRLMPWVREFMQNTTFEPKPRKSKPRPEVNWYYLRAKEDDDHSLEEGGDETDALRREWWYEAGNTYVYQCRCSVNAPWGTVYGEYEDKGYPKWVAEMLLAHGLHPSDIAPEGAVPV